MRRATALRIARLTAGLRLEDAAHATGLSRSRLARLERGEARLDVEALRALSHLYGVEERQLEAGLERAR